MIELLVVIAIISILAALLLPALSEAKRQAGVASCANISRQLVLGMHSFAVDHDSYLPAPTTNTWSTPSANPFGTDAWLHIATANGYQTFNAGTDVDSLGWKVLDDAGGHIKREQLLACPGRRDPYCMAGDGSNGVFGFGQGQMVHYSYRYNGARQDRGWGKGWARALQNGGKLLKSNGDTTYQIGTNSTFPPASALIWDFPAWALHYPGGDMNIEACAMRPNPANWGHLRGGNVGCLDGSVVFVRNAYDVTTTPDRWTMNWPSSSHADSCNAEINPWDNRNYNLGAQLDKLMRRQ